ncbi:MAG: TfoX/Sxy family protein [Bacteroidetes bacterium]|nr:TfoX/Sxy family protein [Bacteroidota bacterium]
MAFNEYLLNRTRELIAQAHDKVEEKKMFGGVCFMVDDKMCVGIVKDSLMVRIDPALFDDILEKEDCRPMDFTGKSMKGFLYVDETALSSTKKLEFWIQLALDFNPFAKASPKKKKKT